MSELKEEQVVTDAPQPDEEGVELPTTPSITGETSSQSGETAIPQPSVEDMAAHDYQSLIPVFYKYVDFMSKKQLRNLMKALVEYPLERDQPKLAFEDERKAFYFGMPACRNGRNANF